MCKVTKNKKHTVACIKKFFILWNLYKKTFRMKKNSFETQILHTPFEKEDAHHSLSMPVYHTAAYEFETDTWGKLLVVSLEFAPRDEAIEWARQLTGKPKYKNHKVILLTHSYMSPEAVRHVKEDYKVSPANYGQAIWDKLVYPSQNICMVICGHECEIVDYEGQVSFRTDKNKFGKQVSQMMFNAQIADGQWHGNGGDCWLRLMEFLPDGKTISVRTFSPLFALSPTTFDKAWRTAPYDQFKITIE